MPRLSKIGAAAAGAFGINTPSLVAVTYLVVAGGGSGAAGNGGGGGGGAGGLLTGTSSLNTTLSYTVTVGAGGAGTSSAPYRNSGSNSVFNTITSIGGGGGGYDGTYTPQTGGSGGGGNYGSTAGASGTSGQGTAGGNNTAASGAYGGGGGGGAGIAGSNGTSTAGGNGGTGLQSSITGTSTYYAGGGGGGSNNTSSAGTGGTGGGGNGGNNNTDTATPATSNTGGGGGAGGGGSQPGKNGGSGVVIISYPAPQKFGGGVVTMNGTNVVHTFNTSGTLVPLNALVANYLVVAGGGGGGYDVGGGGGGGGLLTGSGLIIDTNSNYLITVGAGGTGASSSVNGVNGSNSSLSMVTTTAIGGGGGASASGTSGSNGGSGGGGTRTSAAGGSGTAGQGYAGGSGSSTSGANVSAAGGGGGSAGVGANATGGAGGNGGNGVTSSISGTSTYYAGGGGGRGDGTATQGTGGYGGGGSAGSTGTSATSNQGGGGGGGSTGGGGNGGSGVVIISYPGTTQLMAGGTVTITGGNVIHTFNNSGYLAPIKYVNNSLRFRSSASAYLSRTPATAGNQQKWTFSAWVKRGTLSGALQKIFEAGSSSANYLNITWNGTGGGSGADQLDIYANVSSTMALYFDTSSLYRDPAAWYHVVIGVDTTQATSTNRVKMYVNGVQLTAFASSTYPTQNTSLAVNGNVPHAIGNGAFTNGNYLDGYLSEVQLIDGQQLTPNAFGTFNSYGVWQPITYGGSYGTNGFYLPFTNKTSTTTLGYDFGPAGNNWTTNNISLTTGSTYDSMTDVPTLTSATAANYAVLNPLSVNSSGAIQSGVLTNGNLQFSTSTTNTVATSTIGIASVATGQFYAEFIMTANGGGFPLIGITTPASPSLSSSSYICVAYRTNGQVDKNGVTQTTVATYTTSDVIGMAIDMTTSGGQITFYKNNTSVATITGLVSQFSGNFIVLGCQTNGGSTTTFTANFGQQPFVYSLPSGYVALNTYNL